MNVLTIEELEILIRSLDLGRNTIKESFDGTFTKEQKMIAIEKITLLQAKLIKIRNSTE